MRYFNFNNLKERGPVNLYLVSHTHLDPGWIKTFENYYKTEVKEIMDTVIENLSRNESLKFTWCETSFLKRYWTDESVPEEYKTNFTKLLKEERIHIVGGGWVQHDEVLTTAEMQEF